MSTETGQRSSESINYGRLPFAMGAAGGVVTWVLGYALTYLLAASEVEDSILQRFIEAVEGDPATYEMVGWVFYNSHMVDTMFRGIPAINDQSTNFIGGDNGLSVFLYVIPIGLLLAVGLALGRSQGVVDTSTGLLVGLTVAPGYLLLSVVGVFVFEVSIGGATIGPDLLTAVLLAGLAYPAALGGLGGVLAALTAPEE